MKKILLVFLGLFGIFSTSSSVEYTKDIYDNKVEINFLIKGKNVYFGKQKLERLNSVSFKEINEYYLKDKEGVYYFFTNHIIAGIIDFEESLNENGNWFKSDIKEDDQIYGVEAKILKLKEADSNDYKVKGQYLFSNNYIFNSGQLVKIKKNKYFIIDQKTLEIIDQNCKDFMCNIIIKDKNNLYILIDDISNEMETDEQGYYTENIRKTKVYEIKNIDTPTFSKIDTLKYKDKNKVYTFKDLMKKGIKK